jgi:hypothetical protein
VLKSLTPERLKGGRRGVSVGSCLKVGEVLFWGAIARGKASQLRVQLGGDVFLAVGYGGAE